jgi:hypothetical protein
VQNITSKSTKCRHIFHAFPEIHHDDSAPSSVAVVGHDPNPPRAMVGAKAEAGLNKHLPAEFRNDLLTNLCQKTGLEAAGPSGVPG